MARLRFVERRLVLAAMLAGLPASAAQARPTTATTALVAADEASALVEDRLTTRPVEALSDRTEFSQTFVNPSGTLTLKVSTHVHTAMFRSR